MKPVNRDLLVPLLEELEFKSLLQKLIGESPSSAPTKTPPAPTSSAAKISVGITQSLAKDVVITGEISVLEKGLSHLKNNEIWFDVTPRGVGLQMDSNVYRYEGDGDQLGRWLNKICHANEIILSGYDTKSVAHQLNLNENSFQK